jgi:hypothetical protein
MRQQSIAHTAQNSRDIKLLLSEFSYFSPPSRFPIGTISITVLVISGGVWVLDDLVGLLLCPAGLFVLYFAADEYEQT